MKTKLNVFLSKFQPKLIVILLCLISFLISSPSSLLGIHHCLLAQTLGQTSASQLSLERSSWVFSGIALLFFSFLQACWAYFMYFTFQPGQILHTYRLWIDNFKDKFWFKPLGGCSSCMNIWGALIGFWLVHGVIGFAPTGIFILVWWLGYALVANFWLSKMW